MPKIAHACEGFAHELRCPNVYLTVNDAFVHTDGVQGSSLYHPISHLMGHQGSARLPVCDSRHVYQSYTTLDILPPGLMDKGGLYVVYPLRRTDTCIGTVVTEGLSPLMRHGFLTFCLTLLSAGIMNVRNVELLNEANSRLDNLYVHDELTGLFNRFGLERFGVIAYEHLLRDFDEAHFTFVDIDNMKGINDGLGHEQGDSALRDTADVIRRAIVSENAFAMRYGGDEFLVISRRDITSKLEEQLNLLKRSVERPYDLSLSIGSIVATADEHVSMDEAIRTADSKMYQIKRKRKVARG